MRRDEISSKLREQAKGLADICEWEEWACAQRVGSERSLWGLNKNYDPAPGSIPHCEAWSLVWLGLQF